ncbi:MAG: hypothetical protein H7Z40_17495 [Phycisphaerae bacterium]|nr:hypothetical protein [Gemmatimonadaceae bacterium]
MATTPPPNSPKQPGSPPKADRRALRGRLVIGGKLRAQPISPRTWVAAVGVHFVVIAVLVRLVSLGHGLHDWFGLVPARMDPLERVTYVEATKPEPKPPEPKPVVPRKALPTVRGPVVSIELPAPPPGVAVDPTRLAGTRLTDSTGAGNGIPRDLGINPALIGLAPANGDPRVWQQGTGGINVERSPKQMLDSVIGWRIAQAADSLDSIARLYDANREPADWTKRMKNGEKWGWDKTGLRLGKYTVPNALLALLPASIQRGMSSNPIEAANARALLLARSDINRFSSQAMGEGDFRKALKEMRERKDRDYKKRSNARATENNKPPPPKAAGSSGPDR